MLWATFRGPFLSTTLLRHPWQQLWHFDGLNAVQPVKLISWQWTKEPGSKKYVDYEIVYVNKRAFKVRKNTRGNSPVAVSSNQKPRLITPYHSVKKWGVNPWVLHFMIVFHCKRIASNFHFLSSPTFDAGFGNECDFPCITSRFTKMWGFLDDGSCGASIVPTFGG